MALPLILCPRSYRLHPTNQGLPIPDDVYALLFPVRSHVRFDIEMEQQFCEDQPHLVPGHIHTQAVPRPQREGLVRISVVIFIFGVT